MSFTVSALWFGEQRSRIFSNVRRSCGVALKKRGRICASHLRVVANVDESLRHATIRDRHASSTPEAFCLETVALSLFGVGHAQLRCECQKRRERASGTTGKADRTRYAQAHKRRRTGREPRTAKDVSLRRQVLSWIMDEQASEYVRGRSAGWGGRALRSEVRIDGQMMPFGVGEYLLSTLMAAAFIASTYPQCRRPFSALTPTILNTSLFPPTPTALIHSSSPTLPYPPTQYPPASKAHSKAKRKALGARARARPEQPAAKVRFVARHVCVPGCKQSPKAEGGRKRKEAAGKREEAGRTWTRGVLVWLACGAGK
ncbi:hypothetical protein IWZ00DRAFT_327257 [Phyllosticta capitalensis]